MDMDEAQSSGRGVIAGGRRPAGPDRRPSRRESGRLRAGALGFVLLALPSLSHAWSGAHWKITKAALAALPQAEMTHWQDVHDGFKKFCVYPDMGLANEEAKPYLVVIGGRLLHYFPRENLADFRFFNEGAEIYFTRIVSEMRKGRYDEAARFAGAFAHVIEDLSQPQCHALEGINGFAWAVLDELFTPEDQTWNRAPQSIISLDDNPRFAVDLPGYVPRLLGTHPAEAAFRLYQRCCRLRSVARKALPPVLAAVYAGDIEAAVEADMRPAVECAKTLADMFHTCFVMARGDPETERAPALQTMDLTSLTPIAAPALISIPYRFSPLAYGCSVGMDRKPVPLRLFVQEEDGEKREKVLEKGIGTGCCRFSYEIPAGVFGEFRCLAGLHATLGAHPSGANLHLSVVFRGRKVFDSGVLAAGSPAQPVAVALAEGGALELVSQGNPGLANNYANHAVWGEPVLVRLDPDARERLAARSGRAGEEAAAVPEPEVKLGPNLLPNGSFEEWGEDGLPTSWRAHLRKDAGSKIAPETTETHSGKTSARFTVDDAASIAALWSVFRNEPGKRYRVTFFWKSPVGVIQYAVKKHDAKQGWIAFTGSVWQRANANPLATGPRDTWNRMLLDVPAWEDSTDMTVEVCRPGAPSAGRTFFVDDVAVQEILEP